jgi:diguanylate cyclase (GGDEF)-like protein
LLPETKKEEAFQTASRILKVIEDFTFSGIPRKITVSIGLARVPDPLIDNSEKLINAADLALYEAKSKGRNRVEIFSEHK